jgi:hypothetical protein
MLHNEVMAPSLRVWRYPEELVLKSHIKNGLVFLNGLLP